MKKDFILTTELIGKTISISNAENNSLKGIKGKIINETKNMLTIETKNGEKRLIKSEVTIEMKDKGKTYEINGKLLVNKPEDRIKKMRTI